MKHPPSIGKIDVEQVILNIREDLRLQTDEPGVYAPRDREYEKVVVDYVKALEEQIEYLKDNFTHWTGSLEDDEDEAPY